LGRLPQALQKTLAGSRAYERWSWGDVVTISWQGQAVTPAGGRGGLLALAVPS